MAFRPYSSNRPTLAFVLPLLIVATASSAVAAMRALAVDAATACAAAAVAEVTSAATAAATTAAVAPAGTPLLLRLPAPPLFHPDDHSFSAVHVSPPAAAAWLLLRRLRRMRLGWLQLGILLTREFLLIILSSSSVSFLLFSVSLPSSSGSFPKSEVHVAGVKRRRFSRKWAG